MGFPFKLDSPSKPGSRVNTQHMHQLKQGLVTALAVGVTLMFVAYLVIALNWHSRTFFGAVVSQTMVVSGARPTGSESWNGLAAGLNARDYIAAINGETLLQAPGDFLSARQRFDRIMDSLEPGMPITVDAVRPDGTTLNVTYDTQRSPNGDFLIYFLVPYISGAIVLAAAWTILLRRSHQPGALLSIVATLLVAVFMAGVFDVGTTQVLAPIYYFSTAMLGGVIVVLAMSFPSRLTMLYRQPWLPIVPLTLGAVAGAYAVYNHYFPPTPTAYIYSPQVIFTVATLGMAAFILLMYWQRRQSSTQLTHDQSGMLLMGAALAFAPAVVWSMGQFVHLFDSAYVVPITLESSLPFLIAPILALAYALLEDRYFDTDRMMSQAITYVILMFTLVIGYFLLVLGSSLLVTAVLPNNPLLIALTLFMISLLFIPVRGRLQTQIDRIFFRERRSLQEKIEGFSEQLNSLDGHHAILNEFSKLTQEALQPESIFIYLPKGPGEDFIASSEGTLTDIRFAPDSGVVQYLQDEMNLFYLHEGKPLPRPLLAERTRLNILRPAVVAGLVGKDQLNGFVLIGQPRSGKKQYDYEEIRFLSAMIGQLSVAVERATVIDSLQRSVGELNVLSQVSQAMSFAIEFDDLLELIYAQTARLIDASHFYIALYDNINQQMYFAFYLEDDERYTEFENKRWRLGDDIFSQTVQSGHPLLVEDYQRALAQEVYRPIFDSITTVRALMCVPLVAQTRTLGVVGIGRERSEAYNPAQVKIFGNIAALAATSLDRVRLFTEANARARQLAALNDISQKLVAAESENIESLLNIITLSAVDILNAEAGSLLLVDDRSGDLEFRVVIGGAGETLVGQRLKPDYGLVGEVMRTGQPQISNVSSDSLRRTDDRPEFSGFKTESILAVPLIAKDRIIGVLEVLNRKDRTAFVKDDEELLTTLAGQAAVAIENARLFQMTGSALNERLIELQTLEQIDKELARELDLEKVAQITLKWALANTDAAAGAVGEVDDLHNTLHFRAQHGYEGDQLPGVVSLDRGIIRRVMRTRLPDLADTSIDPDYTESLPGATSQITVPMISGQDVIAILLLETNREPRLNLLHLEFIKRLAERASIALANAQLYEQVKAAAETKSEFVGFAAHELKNPLTSIKGYAALFEMMDDDQRGNALRVIRSNADRMQGIIDDMRDIAKSDAGRLQLEIRPVRPFDIAQDAITPFEQQIAEKRQTVTNQINPELPLVRADHSKLVQVMVNLVSNAYKYSPEEASITVDARVRNDYIDERGRNPGPMVEFTVTDTGIGMSESDLQRIFHEDYFRSDNRAAREQKGTGLGMIITERIVRLHGGRIWVTSELGVGTTFYFVVPVMPETPSKMADHQDATQTRATIRRRLGELASD